MKDQNTLKNSRCSFDFEPSDMKNDDNNSNDAIIIEEFCTEDQSNVISDPLSKIDGGSKCNEKQDGLNVLDLTSVIYNSDSSDWKHCCIHPIIETGMGLDTNQRGSNEAPDDSLNLVNDLNIHPDLPEASSIQNLSLKSSNKSDSLASPHRNFSPTSSIISDDHIEILGQVVRVPVSSSKTCATQENKDQTGNIVVTLSDGESSDSESIAEVDPLAVDTEMLVVEQKKSKLKRKRGLESEDEIQVLSTIRKRQRLSNEELISTREKLVQEYILHCVKNWQMAFSWLTCSDSSKNKNFCLSLSCNICNCNGNFIKIVNKDDTSKVSSKLEYHEKSNSHVMNIFISNSSLFFEVYRTLKYDSRQAKSIDDLVIKINNFSRNNSSINKGFLFGASKVISSVIDQNIFVKLKNKKFSLVCDPCRRILILRAVSPELLPREYLVTSFPKKNDTLQHFLTRNGLAMKDLVYHNSKSICRQCQNCLGIVLNNNVLPLSYPKPEDLLCYLQENDVIKNYYKCVSGILNAYILYPSAFSNIPLSSVTLSQTNWTDVKLYNFLIQHQSELAKVCIVAQNTGGPSILEFQKICGDDFLKSIFSFLKDCQSEKVPGSYFESDLKVYEIASKFSLLRNALEGNANPEQLEVLEGINSYVVELMRPVYSLGRSNLLDFSILFDSDLMIRLSADKELEKSFERIYFFLSSHLSKCKEALMSEFLHFGDLLKKTKIKKFSLFYIMDKFRVGHDLRENFGSAYELYSLVALLPSFSLRNPLSLYNVNVWRAFYTKRFAQCMGEYIYGVSEGPPIEEASSILEVIRRKKCV